MAHGFVDDRHAQIRVARRTNAWRRCFHSTPISCSRSFPRHSLRHATPRDPIVCVAFQSNGFPVASFQFGRALLLTPWSNSPKSVQTFAIIYFLSLSDQLYRRVLILELPNLNIMFVSSDFTDMEQCIFKNFDSRTTIKQQLAWFIVFFSSLLKNIPDGNFVVKVLR